jgi:hypothetical protein
MYTKIFQKAAFRLESGKVGVNQAPGWGSTNVNTPLGSNCALPYLSFSKSKTINTVSDNSIVGQGYADLPRKVSSYVEQGITFVNKFDGLNALLYWAFGREDAVKSVICYTCSTPVTEPIPGATYTDPSSNSLVFLRKEINKSTTFYIFSQSVAPVATSGTLTKVTGTGSNLTFSLRSVLMYEHIFTLDPLNRHLIAPEVSERLTGYSVGDLKCRMALLGLNLGSNTDLINYNAMCKKINFTSNAASLSEITIDYLAREQSIGNFTSSNWTYPPGLVDSDSDIIHHQYFVQLSEASVISLIPVGVTSIELGFESPLQVLQDTSSGLYLAEPVMEGKYIINSNITLSRYSSTTWQSICDAWTQVVARISATDGYYLQEFLINNAIITAAGPDEDNVSKEPLTVSSGNYETNRWSSYMYGMVQSHSPLMLRVRNLTVENMMLS